VCVYDSRLDGAAEVCTCPNGKLACAPAATAPGRSLFCFPPMPVTVMVVPDAAADGRDDGARDGASGGSPSTDGGSGG